MKTIVFCLPGRQFSGNFLQSWTMLLSWCINNGIKPIVINRYSCNIYYVRNMCLGGNNLNGKTQKPFQGMMNYDYMMWIDSDMVFGISDFEKLLNHDKDIASGLYLMEDNHHYATVKNWDEEYFSKHGSFEFLNEENIGKSKFFSEDKLISVDYTGFGWILIKKGVFESLEYPWFRPLWKEFTVDGRTFTDFTMEDVGFCHSVKERGYKIHVDPAVIVGHEKSKILLRS